MTEQSYRKIITVLQKSGTHDKVSSMRIFLTLSNSNWIVSQNAKITSITSNQQQNKYTSAGHTSQIYWKNKRENLENILLYRIGSRHKLESWAETFAIGVQNYIYNVQICSFTELEVEKLGPSSCETTTEGPEKLQSSHGNAMKPRVNQFNLD